MDAVPPPWVPPQPPPQPLGEPQEHAALAQLGKTALSESLQGKTHLPWAISMKTEDQAYTGTTSCSFSRAAPLCSGSTLPPGAPAALAGRVFLFPCVF